MIAAKTLVHAASIPIARHAVRTFCITHRDLFRELEIHTDGSLTEEHRSELGELTSGMAFRFVEPAERRLILENRIKGYPAIQSLMSGRSYFSKMELPMIASEPYFYFDSDIVWIRPCPNLIGNGSQNLFSTETWTWYPGIRKELSWVRAGVPRRVNSGFYYLADSFPSQRLERLLSQKMYDPKAPYATDQEIMAFLYPRMRLYHPEDLMRSRRGIMYNLNSLNSIAIHYPGAMWKNQLSNILSFQNVKTLCDVRFKESSKLTLLEILNMKFKIKIAEDSRLRIAMHLYQYIRKIK